MLEGSVFAGRYRVLRPLGAGAMGTVYEVLDVDTDRRRALKVMRAPSGHRADGERWKREARIAGKLDSRFIVDVLDVGVDDATGMRFLIMELLQGEDLGRRVKRLGPLPASEVALYLHQAALALDRMHRAGIVHRDLKPANLFRDERDGDAPRCKIVDLGVAIEGGAREAAALAGTPLYMAPEQFRDGVPIDAAADVFALGMVAFTLLSGRPFWAEEWETCRARSDEARGPTYSPEISDRIRFALIAVRGPAEPACQRAARCGVSLPPSFDAWFAQATAVDPRRRFASAGAAAQALARLFGVDLPPELRSGDIAAVGASLEETGTTTEVDAATNLAVDSTLTAAELISAATNRTEPGGDATARSRQRSRSRSRRLAAGSAVIAIAFVGASLPVRGREAPVRSPLAAPDTVLACPVMEVSGLEATDKRPGWLGAAAASLICARARLVLGGRADRTRIPAELLGLPATPVDDLPEDPYGEPDARARSLETVRAAMAAHMVAAYVDGSVTKEATSFRVKIVLRSAAGELATTHGAGRSLLDAVRVAMNPLLDPALLPWADALDPDVAEFTRASDPEAALALFDLSAAMIHNAGDLAAECDRIAQLGDQVREMAVSEKLRCAFTRGEPKPDHTPLGDDPSHGAIAVRARIGRIYERKDDSSLADKVARLFEAKRSSFGRSVLGATASCLLQGIDEPRAADMARLAVQEDPKNPTGENCAPWVQLATITEGTTSAVSTVHAMQAWAPWDTYGWAFGARRDPAMSLVYARRAYVLSPFDTYVAFTLADELLSRREHEEVRYIAASLSLSSDRAPVLAAEVLQVRVDASMTEFRRGVYRAVRAMQVAPGDSGWLLVLRLDLAWRALELAEILGGAETRKVADQIVEQFLYPEPARLDGGHLDVPQRLPAICARASAKVAERCFKRLREIRPILGGGILLGTDDFTAGAERYARGDLHGAARAWRHLLPEPGPFAEVMLLPMMATFERTGHPAIVEKLASAVPDTSQATNGASFAMVHAARRAASRGDRVTAIKLAEKIINAWQYADEDVPAVKEMHRLLKRLRR